MSFLKAIAPLLTAEGVLCFNLRNDGAGKFVLAVMPDDKTSEAYPALANSVEIAGTIEEIEAKIPELQTYAVTVQETSNTLAEATAAAKAAAKAPKKVTTASTPKLLPKGSATTELKPMPGPSVPDLFGGLEVAEVGSSAGSQAEPTADDASEGEE